MNRLFNRANSVKNYLPSSRYSDQAIFFFFFTLQLGVSLGCSSALFPFQVRKRRRSRRKKKEVLDFSLSSTFGVGTIILIDVCGIRTFQELINFVGFFYYFSNVVEKAEEMIPIYKIWECFIPHYNTCVNP